MTSQVFGTDGDSAEQLILDEDDFGLQKQLPDFVDSAAIGRMVSFYYF